MVTITPNTGSERLDVELPEEGAYPARLISIVHQWTIVGRYWPQTQCIMRFELPTETAVFVEWWEELPHAVNVYVSVSYSKKGAFLTVLDKLGVNTSWEFNLEDVLGKTCQISITHKKSWDKTYLNAKWKDIAKLMKGTKVPEQKNDSKIFWFTADYTSEEKEVDGEMKYVKTGCSNVTMEGYDTLTDREKEKINSSWEYIEYSANQNTIDLPDTEEDERF